MAAVGQILDREPVSLKPDVKVSEGDTVLIKAKVLNVGVGITVSVDGVIVSDVSFAASRTAVVAVIPREIQAGDRVVSNKAVFGSARAGGVQAIVGGMAWVEWDAQTYKGQSDHAVMPIDSLQRVP